MKDSLYDKLRKIKELVERGSENEKQTAAKMLEKLLLKYNLTIADLTASEPQKCKFTYRRKQDLTLLLHVVCKVKRSDSVGVTRWESAKRTVYVDLTPTQKAEVDLLLKTYRRALHKETEKLLDAFILVNQIFNTDQAPEKPELTKEQLQQLEATLRMAQGVTRVRIPRKDRALVANNPERTL